LRHNAIAVCIICIVYHHGIGKLVLCDWMPDLTVGLLPAAGTWAGRDSRKRPPVRFDHGCLSKIGPERKAAPAQRRDLESADRVAATQRPHADLKSLPRYCCTAAVHGEEALEKQSGRRDLNPRPLDPVDRYWHAQGSPSIRSRQRALGRPQRYPMMRLDAHSLLYSGAVRHRRPPASRARSHG
jgi:hypothetical protein